MKNQILINFDCLYLGQIKYKELSNKNLIYYDDFRNLMIGLSDNDKYNYHESNYYQKCINIQNDFNIFYDKASIINIAKFYNCKNDVASQIYAISNNNNFNKNLIVKDIKQALDIIIQNYFEILGKIKQNKDDDQVDIGIILADIDQFGKIRIIDGYHRAILYDVAGYHQIMVTIINRHPLWMNFVNFFENESIKLYQQPMLLYEKINHPDFSDFKVIRDNRMAIIYDEILKIQSNTDIGLDLGCFIGTNSHYLQRKGIKMYGIEYEKKYYDAAMVLNKTYDLNVTFINEDVYTFIDQVLSEEKKYPKYYDLIIILSLAYHLYRNDPIKATNFFQKIISITKIIIIDDEPNTKLFTKKDIKNIFVGSKIKKIFTGKDRRNIYLIQL